MNVQTLTQDSKTRNKKSISLNADEKKLLKRYAEKFDTKDEAADEIGIRRGTLHDILERGRCAGSTFNKLVEKGIITAREAA